MSKLPENVLFRHLTRISHEVSFGRYENVGAIFELTKENEYPSEVAIMAESIGMMIVRIEAKQQYLERLIEELNQRQRELELTTTSLKDANTGILESLGSAIAKRDSDTNAHSYRVTLLALQLGRAAGLDDSALQGLVKGSFLHDLGKIAIRDSILMKPGKLTADEYVIMKSHVIHGSDIIRSYRWLEDACAVVKHHHEKFNGQGYPDKLAGSAIPLIARIFAVADVFDALVSVRPYKDAFPYDEAMRQMSAGRGGHFDPEILDMFTTLIPGLFGTLYSMNEQELATLMRRQMGFFTQESLA
jgi:HD-GYP domain-containing protein (c-di-GMP phosphodiesterase class II)